MNIEEKNWRNATILGKLASTAYPDSHNTHWIFTYESEPDFNATDLKEAQSHETFLGTLKRGGVTLHAFTTN